ncbi:MAG TPA: hypothetical protein VEB59_07535 [Gemmatimonadales bacterium]|nr:hypothetical protein [Gemmatimonadales bacterium]
MAPRGPFAIAVRMAALVLTLPACGDEPTASGPPGALVLTVAGGGHNVPDRYSTDLWIHGGYAYTGTSGASRRAGKPGDVVKIWRLDPRGAPVLADSVRERNVVTVSDVQVSEDGELLLFSAEGGVDEGLFLYGLTDPEHPVKLGHVPVAGGVHTATLADINGRRYAFAARNPPVAQLAVYDITTPATARLVASVPVAPKYGVHDTFVRDGLAFVFAWNSGVLILDVGNGVRGGTPSQPVEVGGVVPSANGVPGGPASHNGWWFHNRASGERRYLFVGQEGPMVVGSRTSGDIHVIDVSDLAAPREVAFFHLDGAGTHNFWMDERRQILYAAYYNEGVVALDVSGELEGDLSDRLIGRIRPGGDTDTFTWGVMLAGGSLYASDMLSGLWQLTVGEAP